MADAQQPDTLLADLALPSFFSHVRHQKAWNSPQSSFLRFFCINGTKTKSIPGSFRLPCGDRHAGERSTLHSQMIEGMMFNCTLYKSTCGMVHLWQDKMLFPFNSATVPRLYATVIVPLHTTLPVSRCSCLEVLFHLYCVAITAPQLSLSRCSSRHADIQPLHPSTAIKASRLFLYPHYCAARWDHTATVLGLQQIEGNITDPHQICLASQLYKDQF